MTLLIFQLVYLCNNNRWFKKVVERGRKEIKKKKKKGELRFLARVSSRGRRYFLSFLFPLSFERNNLVRVNFVSRREFFFFFFSPLCTHRAGVNEEIAGVRARFDTGENA